MGNWVGLWLNTSPEPVWSVMFYVVATFTPTSSHISNAGFMHSLLLASNLAAGRRSAPRDRYDGHSYFASICYLLVSGSVRVRVRARARVSARVTVRDRDRI